MKIPSGFVDLPDAALAAHKIVTDDQLVKIIENANFGVDRLEYIFMGFYKHGDQVSTPVSPVDGYAYSQEEVMYDWTHYSSFAADDNFVSGQAAPPSGGNGLSQKPQPADIYYWTVDVDDSTGKVYVTQSYFAQGAVAETVGNDGVIKVYAICQRASINIQN